MPQNCEDDRERFGEEQLSWVQSVALLEWIKLTTNFRRRKEAILQQKIVKFPVDCQSYPIKSVHVHIGALLFFRREDTTNSQDLHSVSQ